MGYEEEFVKYVRAVADGVHRIGAADRAAARQIQCDAVRRARRRRPGPPRWPRAPTRARAVRRLSARTRTRTAQ